METWQFPSPHPAAFPAWVVLVAGRLGLLGLPFLVEAEGRNRRPFGLSRGLHWPGFQDRRLPPSEPCSKVQTP